MNKDKKGFTLIEIIFSVAFLSVVCVIMLKLLFTSYDIEKKTDTYDVATVVIMSAIENVKSDVHIEAKELITYFDQNWQVTTYDQAMFKMRITTKRNIKYFGVLYDIFADIEYLEGENLLSIQTKHYYGKE
jgi:type II secretory pathway pseudopilin PulG